MEWRENVVRVFGGMEISNHIPDSECTVIFVFASAMASILLLRRLESQRAPRNDFQTTRLKLALAFPTIWL